MNTKWKIKIFGIWFTTYEFIADLCFKTTFIGVCNQEHTIGRNLKECVVDDKKYIIWEHELILLG